MVCITLGPFQIDEVIEIEEILTSTAYIHKGPKSRPNSDQRVTHRLYQVKSIWSKL